MLGVPVHRHPTVTATVPVDFSSVPIMANIGRLDLVREGEGYVAHYHDFKGGPVSYTHLSSGVRSSTTPRTSGTTSTRSKNAVA